jgi:hypothetical protein
VVHVGHDGDVADIGAGWHRYRHGKRQIRDRVRCLPALLAEAGGRKAR